MTNGNVPKKEENEPIAFFINIKMIFSTIGFVFLDIPKSDCIDKMNKVFSDETRLKENLQGNLELAKSSFEEIKHLTEYEDEKANRILAAVAFLSALSGILFVNLVPKNINGQIIPLSDLNYIGFLYYGLFCLYIVCLVIGAIGVIGSIEPRFNLGKGGKSLLFAPLVVKETPEDWVNKFQGKDKKELQLAFTKCYVIESYLIAEKIINKLRYLQPSVQIIRFSIMILLLWIIATGTRLLISPVKSPLLSGLSQSAPPSSNPVQKPQSSSVQKPHSSSFTKVSQPSTQKASTAPSRLN